MSRYETYSRVPGEQFSMRVHSAEVRGLFGGSGTVSGIVLSGTVYSGNTLVVKGGKAKPYTVTSISVVGNSPRPEAGANVRLEVVGIKKKDLAPGSVLLGNSGSGKSLLIDVYEYEGEERDYFAEVFARYFPDCDIRKNQTIRGEKGEAIPVDFLFYKGGSPYLAIFLRDTTEWKKKEATYLKNVCTEQRIKMLNFISNFQNEVKYVCDRVEAELG